MPELSHCHLKMKIYTGEKMEVIGMATVAVQSQNIEKRLAIIAVEVWGLICFDEVDYRYYVCCFSW